MTSGVQVPIPVAKQMERFFHYASDHGGGVRSFPDCRTTEPCPFCDARDLGDWLSAKLHDAVTASQRPGKSDSPAKGSSMPREIQ